MLLLRWETEIQRGYLTQKPMLFLLHTVLG